MRAKPHKPKRVNLVTLGCAKNQVDSENIATQLQHARWDVVHDGGEEAAEVVIVNTCGFIDRAKEQSIDAILEFAQAKNEGKIEQLFVTGCLSQRYRDELRKEIPEVDDWFGTMDLPLLLARFQADYRHELLGERQITTPRHYAYLKISEGCNRSCSFCAIPLMRGAHVSRPIEELVAEARYLARHGTRELILIAQELTYYGLDRYKRRALPELLHALADVPGVEWIRLHYAYPSKFPMEVLEVMAQRPEVCKYLDIPLQHAADSVLKRMRRQITRAQTEALIQHIRARVPDITLRTTFLVGFPGETEQEFEALCAFVRAMEFDRVGVFQYSHEEHTPAYALPDDVPPEVKEARAHRIMHIQQEISLRKNLDKVGKVFKVLFDRVEDGFFVGRTEGDSPEVDNEVRVKAESQYVRVGDFAHVRIEQATEYDLYGRVVAEPL